MIRIYTLFFLVLSFNIGYSQTKKDQISQLNITIDSLNQVIKQVNDSKIKTIDSLNNVLFLCNSDLENKNLIIDKINKNLSQAYLQIDSLKQFIEIGNNDGIKINRENIIDFVNSINKKRDIEIPYTSFLTETLTSDTKHIYSFDFSSLNADYLMDNFNLESFEGLSSKLVTDENNQLLYITWVRSCCPGDNEEEMIIPIGDDLYSIHHYFGMSGGIITFSKNGLNINQYGYSREDEETEFILKY